MQVNRNIALCFGFNFWFGMLCLHAFGARARADGAFPDSMGIFLPADKPNQIIATMNFGLLISDDSGVSWKWVCEQAIGQNISLVGGPPISIYQLGPVPEDYLHAVSSDGVFSSMDSACTWKAATGPMTDPTDVFPDPSNASHVLALSATGLYQSNDAARSFTGPTYSGGDKDLVSVEIARSDPNTTYLTMFQFVSNHPYVARSNDGEQTWQAIDVQSTVGSRLPRILAVDPLDAKTLYFRLTDFSTAQDALGVSHDGGESVHVALQLEDTMSAFLRRSDGALMVGTTNGGGFISTDHAETFSPWTTTLHFRALAEREGLIYAALDNANDGYAVGVSMDQGVTFSPLLRFDQLKGELLDCGDVQKKCAGVWDNLQSMFGIGAPKPSSNPSGCACSMAQRTSSPWWMGVLLLGVVGRRCYVVWMRNARRRLKK